VRCREQHYVQPLKSSLDVINFKAVRSGTASQLRSWCWQLACSAVSLLRCTRFARFPHAHVFEQIGSVSHKLKSSFDIITFNSLLVHLFWFRVLMHPCSGISGMDNSTAKRTRTEPSKKCWRCPNVVFNSAVKCPSCAADLRPVSKQRTS
jgi:hypothetical protein